MNNQTKHSALEYAARKGRLKREIAHLNKELDLMCMTGQFQETHTLPYSNNGNDEQIEIVRLSEDVENALHRYGIFYVGQILDLGKNYLIEIAGFNSSFVEQIELHLREELSVQLQD